MIAHLMLLLRKRIDWGAVGIIASILVIVFVVWGIPLWVATHFILKNW